MNTIRRVTPLDGDYFHGFYNIQPWNASGTHLLCHRVPFVDRMPGRAACADRVSRCACAAHAAGCGSVASMQAAGPW